MSIRGNDDGLVFILTISQTTPDSPFYDLVAYNEDDAQLLVHRKGRPRSILYFGVPAEVAHDFFAGRIERFSRFKYRRIHFKYQVPTA